MSISIQSAHKVKLKVPHGELRTMMDWCERTCENDWLLSIGNDEYTFYFESERDYVTFIIWKR